MGERLFQRKGISSVYISAASSERVNDAEKSVTTFMDKLMVGASSSTTYRIYNQTSVLETLSTATSTLTLMLGGIAAISLLVGGIGIMNIMLVSVSEAYQGNRDPQGDRGFPPQHPQSVLGRGAGC